MLNQCAAGMPSELLLGTSLNPFYMEGGDLNLQIPFLQILSDLSDLTLNSQLNTLQPSHQVPSLQVPAWGSLGVGGGKVEDTLCRGRVLLFVKEEPCQRGLCLAMPCVLLLSLPLASLQADLSGVSGWDHLHSTSGGVVGNLRGAHMICDWIFFFGPRFCGHHPYHSVQSSREFHTYFPACNSQKFWSLCSCAWLTPVRAVLGVWDTWQTERFLKTAAGSLLLLTSFLSFYAMRMS